MNRLVETVAVLLLAVTAPAIAEETTCPLCASFVDLTSSGSRVANVGHCVRMRGIAQNQKIGAMLVAADDSFKILADPNQRWELDDCGHTFDVTGILAYRDVEAVKKDNGITAQGFVRSGRLYYISPLYEKRKIR